MSDRRNLLVAAVVACAALVGGARAADAQSYEVTVEVLPKADPKKDEPGKLAVKVVSPAAPPPVEKLKLIQNDQKAGPIEIGAESLKRYVEGDETLGLAFVFETQHLWLGNDSWWEGLENSKTEGFYKALSGSVDKLAAAGPAGSKAIVIAYGNGADVRWSGDLKDLAGDKLGSQKELSSKPGPDGKPQQVIGMDVTAGVEEAVNQLNKLSVSRKVIVLVGDGLNADGLADVKKRMANDRITAYALFIQSPMLEGDPNGWKKLTNNNKAMETADEFPSKMGWVVDSIADRFYVVFPGFDPKLQRSFTWDEKPHTFTLMIDKAEVETDEVMLTPKWTPPWMRAKGGSKWWLWFIILPLGLILLIVVGVKVLGGKKAPAPEPVVMPAPVAAPVAAPAPAPAGPMKTVMIGIGGDDGGFPVVGWIVPLNGPNQFQTFKLQGGATKIGTGGPAHIVINDGFMSTEHCQIVASPQGFTLVDGGSTNGTYVNDRKVDKHELVDNDVIMMGKTTFRFKSIN